jgi:hypothetical protein
MSLGLVLGPPAGLFVRWLFLGGPSQGPEINYLGDVEGAVFQLGGLLFGGLVGFVLGWSISVGPGEARIPDWLKMVLLGIVVSLPFVGVVAYLFSWL